MRTELAILAVVALAGCGDYDPPMQADHESARYASDLAACQDSASDRADAWAKAHGDRFLTYAVSFPLAQRREITRCMNDKGYVLED